MLSLLIDSPFACVLEQMPVKTVRTKSEKCEQNAIASTLLLGEKASALALLNC
jgi:hypothetical protein